MDFIFKVKDNEGKEIHLSKERWKHIRIEHPEILEPEEIEQAIKSPTKITGSDRDETVRWFYLCQDAFRKLHTSVCSWHLEHPKN